MRDPPAAGAAHPVEIHPEAAKARGHGIAGGGFQPNGTVNVSSYSPYLKTYRTDAENAFTLSL